MYMYMWIYIRIYMYGHDWECGLVACFSARLRPFGFLFPPFLSLVLDSINPPVTSHRLADMQYLLVTFVTEVTLFSRRVELGT